MTNFEKREQQASTEIRWSDQDVLALLRAATAPDWLKDRIHGMLREASPTDKENPA